LRIDQPRGQPGVGARPRACHGAWNQAGGSPFRLEAPVRASRAGLDPGEILAERLRGLTADASAVLADLAVAAKPFSIAELAQLENWPGPRADGAVTEHIGRGLGVGLPSGVTLSHDLIRSAASRVLPASTREAIHRRFAAIL
jgi:hypothetical protein